MAYTPINWQTGDTITAAKLNRCDNGWAAERTQLFSETVTTVDDGSGMYVATLAYSGDIYAATIIVTYDSTEYTCPSIGLGEYGAPYSGSGCDFSEFPFNLYTSGGHTTFTTKTAGTHTIAASTESIEKSKNFSKAVGYWNESTQLFSETVTTVDQEGMNEGFFTFSQAIDADAIAVTFDGTPYECVRIDAFGGYYYGGFSDTGPVFTDYPFCIASDPNNASNMVYTEDAGTYAVAVASISVEASANFAAAVNSCVELPSVPYLLVGIPDGSTDKTWNAICDAYTGGYICIVSGYGPVLQMWYDGSERYYMATGCTNPRNGKFDPAIWRTAGASSDLPLSFYKYDSQMP